MALWRALILLFLILLPGVGVAQPARRTDVVLEQLSHLAEGQRQFIGARTPLGRGPQEIRGKVTRSRRGAA